MERETGIEPATNSLEGCDSTTELLPPTRLTCSLSPRAGGSPRRVVLYSLARHPGWPAAAARRTGRAKNGGEGRARTFEAARATDLQSAAFDRFATSPASCVLENWFVSVYLSLAKPSTELAKGFEPPTC